MTAPRRSTAPTPPLTSSGFADVSELQKYKHIDNIGKGSFGVISRVQRIEDGKEFALKQLDYSKMTDKDRKQMLAEVAILESLKHKNIVQLIQKIKDPQNERIYIVMEYCTSGDLGTLIRKAQRSKIPLNEDKIWNIFLQITLALHHCHWPAERQRERTAPGRSSLAPDGPMGKTQVMHRDLKPENVFLSEDIVKLGDFGLSKDMAGNAFTSTYVGTPLYMPPEILAENKYDTKSDIWSLGCLVFEMCALSSPFATAKTQDELVAMVRSGKLPTLPPHVSPALKTAIKAMLNLNPARRPSTKDLLEMDEMKLHRKLYTLQNQTNLLAQRKNEMQRWEAQLQVRIAAVEAREMELATREANQGEREGLIHAYEQELIKREASVKERELANQENQKRMAAAAESLRAQWDALKDAKDKASERELMGIPGVAVDFAPTISRPTLEERKTVPLPAVSRFQRNHPFEDTPSKAPILTGPNTVSALPLGLGQSSSRSVTPLRRNATKSLGNLAAQARLDAERENLRQIHMGGNAKSMNESTPSRQDSLIDKLERTAIGSPIELDSSRYMEDISMASPAPSVLLSPIVRPRRSSTAPTAAWLQAKNGSDCEPGSASGTSSVATTSSIPPTMIPAPSFVYRPEATPAKWSQDDPDLPSPFIRRTSTAPAQVMTSTVQATRDQHRPVLGSITVQSTVSTSASSTVTSGSGAGSGSGSSSSQPVKKAMPRSRSGNLHQHVLRANATAQAQAQAQHASQALNSVDAGSTTVTVTTNVKTNGSSAAGSTTRSRSTLAGR